MKIPSFQSKDKSPPPQNKKAYHLLTWQSGLPFALIAHVSLFLSGTHSFTAIIGELSLIISFF